MNLGYLTKHQWSQLNEEESDVFLLWSIHALLISVKKSRAMDMKRRCVLVWYFGNRLLVVFYFSAWSRAPFCSNCIQQLGVLTHSADPACLYSETSSHFKDPSGISANSFTSPLNTAPFLGQSGGPEDDAFPLVGSDRQYMPVQCPGCFITNEPADEDIFFIEVMGMDLLANVSPSIEMIMAMICITIVFDKKWVKGFYSIPCSLFCVHVTVFFVLVLCTHVRTYLKFVALNLQILI